MKKITLEVQGMDCASCALIIERALSKKTGVTSAPVNFATKKVQVQFEEDKINIDEIKETIKGTGYSIKENEIDINEKARSSYEKQEKIKVIISALLTLPIFIRMFLPWEIAGQFANISLTYWIQIILASIVVFVFGYPFHVSTIKQVGKFQANMDTLISIGTLAAYFYSLWAVISNNPPIYFDTAAAITTFILLGKYLELKSKNKASSAMEKLLELEAKVANVIDIDGSEREVKIDKINKGDIIIVRPGDKIALDGIVVSGESDIDESMLSGESMPVAKLKNSDVFAGTINLSGVIKIQVIKKQSETMLAQIIRTVEEAQNYKAPIQKLADKISGIFVPIVITLSLLTFLGWYLKTGEVGLSLINAVAVLIISCPCALGIATPIAIMVGTSVGSKNGILIKSGESFEKGKNIDTIVFDKTGTLTKGEPRVHKIISNKEFGCDENTVLKIAASLSQYSKHPLSQAVLNDVKNKNLSTDEMTNFSEVTGKGIIGKMQNSESKNMFGNIKLINENNLPHTWASQILDYHADSEYTINFVVKNDREIIGAILIADELRENAKEAILEIKKMGIDPMIISGDNRNATRAIAAKLGITNFLSEVLPHEKQNEVKNLQAQGKKVIFVGDGINDAPSLVQADLGISLESGTDIAKESGDIIIIQNNPMRVVAAIKLSQKTFKIIKQNLFWAFFYNILAIPLAMLGFINPMVGAIAMGLSDVFVIGNSLRIYRIK